MRFDALVALLKLALNANGDECRIHWLADQTARVGLTTARHNSQVSQLLQYVTSSGGDCECIVQSGDVGACMSDGVVALANSVCAAPDATRLTAVSIAMLLPAQPRNGSRTSINAINK